jgi:predicted TIM-barrel fold metal-dependent hydrolase
VPAVGEVGLACVRAWNDWLFSEWHEPYPERFIPGGITYLGDPVEAVREIRRNADRGFV